MIEGFIGRPGSGKSYTLTEKAIAMADRGRPVFANYGINHPGCFQFTPDQLLDLPPGVIVIDEAHLWFPARMALKLPPSWLAMLSQTRKSGWDLMWCAQHESRVDRVLRDVTSFQYLCSSWFKIDGHPMFFVADAFEPEYFRKKEKRLTRRIRRFSPKVAEAYDTYERLAVAEHAQSNTDAYAKKSTKVGGSVLDGTAVDAR